VEREPWIPLRISSQERCLTSMGDCFAMRKVTFHRCMKKRLGVCDCSLVLHIIIYFSWCSPCGCRLDFAESRKILCLLYFFFLYTTTKPFVPNIWGRLHEPKKNYAGSGTWINFLHSFLSSNMPSLRPLASISCIYLLKSWRAWCPMKGLGVSLPLSS